MRMFTFSNSLVILLFLLSLASSPSNAVEAEEAEEAKNPHETGPDAVSPENG